METVAGTILLTNEPKEGDFIQQLAHLRTGYCMFFRAIKTDEEKAKDGDKLYLKLVLNDDIDVPYDESARREHIEAVQAKLL